jgi:hypothetical protein
VYMLVLAAREKGGGRGERKGNEDEDGSWRRTDIGFLRGNLAGAEWLLDT